MHRIARALATLVLAAIAWVLLGYFATMPLGAVFGWSGHPAMPAAPMEVYVGLYLVALPVVCLLGAWRVTGALSRDYARRRLDRS